MKVAILGTENSHAEAFAKLIRDDKDFENLTMVGAYGYDDKANHALLEKGLVSRFAETPDGFLGEVDAILVTARHGDHHFEYALPYLQKGVSAFIDKPFTVRLDYADKMLEAAKASGALLCGGSSLKFLRDLDALKDFANGKRVLGGHVSAPVNMVNDYAGFYFYAQHLIEMMFSVFGSDVRSVYAYCPNEENNRISVVFNYGDYDVTASYYNGYEYSVCVMTDEGSRRMSTYDLGDCYKRELAEFQTMLFTRKQPHAYESLRKPVALMHMIEQSFRAGKMVYA